jgi:Leucine-rich repeat (LRR) protein
LTLRSISTSGLGFLAGLDHLWSLNVKLGGIRDLSAIQGKQSIKYLELWQIQGLRDVTVVSTLCDLQYLYLQTLRNVIAIPDLSKLRKLRRLYLENMKALVDVSAVPRSPSLQEFIHISAQNIRPAQYEDLPGIKTLRNVLVGFRHRKKINNLKP